MIPLRNERTCATRRRNQRQVASILRCARQPCTWPGADGPSSPCGPPHQCRRQADMPTIGRLLPIIDRQIADGHGRLLGMILPTRLSLGSESRYLSDDCPEPGVHGREPASSWSRRTIRGCRLLAWDRARLPNADTLAKTRRSSRQINYYLSTRKRVHLDTRTVQIRWLSEVVCR